MNVLITGGSGFLGRHLALRLLAGRMTVILYDQQFHELLNPAISTHPRLVMVEGDIRNRDALAETLQANSVQVVIHLAAVLTQTAAEDPALAVQVNALGSALVFTLARQLELRRVIFGSSVAALGLQPKGTPGDDATPRPSSVYGATKAFTEHLARAMRRDHPELDLVGLRFGWIYGPGRRRGWNVMQEVIEGFALERTEVTYPDYPEPNDWTYVSDAVEAICLCMRAPRLSQVVYNAPGDYRSIQDAVRHLQRRFPRVRARPVPAILPPVAWDYRLDRIEQDVGYRPQVRLEQGLDFTLNSIRAAHGLQAIPTGFTKEDIPHG